MGKWLFKAVGRGPVLLAGGIFMMLLAAVYVDDGGIEKTGPLVPWLAILAGAVVGVGVAVWSILRGMGVMIFGLVRRMKGIRGGDGGLAVRVRAGDEVGS